MLHLITKTWGYPADLLKRPDCLGFDRYFFAPIFLPQNRPKNISESWEILP